MNKCIHLKKQQEEFSQQQVRIGLLEKKVQNAGKDADGQIEKIQRKLDDANLQMKQKEK